MAKPNYSFEKRQREMAKKKKEEKDRDKAARKAAGLPPAVDEPEEAEPSTEPGQPG